MISEGHVYRLQFARGGIVPIPGQTPLLGQFRLPLLLLLVPGREAGGGSDAPFANEKTESQGGAVASPRLQSEPEEPGAGSQGFDPCAVVWPLPCALRAGSGSPQAEHGYQGTVPEEENLKLLRIC